MPRDDESRIGDIIEAGHRIAKHIGGRDRDGVINDDTAIRAVLFDIAG